MPNLAIQIIRKKTKEMLKVFLAPCIASTVTIMEKLVFSLLSNCFLIGELVSNCSKSNSKSNFD